MIRIRKNNVNDQAFLNSFILLFELKQGIIISNNVKFTTHCISFGIKNFIVYKYFLFYE